MPGGCAAGTRPEALQGDSSSCLWQAGSRILARSVQLSTERGSMLAPLSKRSCQWQVRLQAPSLEAGWSLPIAALTAFFRSILAMPCERAQATEPQQERRRRAAASQAKGRQGGEGGQGEEGEAAGERGASGGCGKNALPTVTILRHRGAEIEAAIGRMLRIQCLESLREPLPEEARL